MKIETYEKTINTEEYTEGYVNVEEFLAYCKECENYDRKWSCPSYDFAPEDYWKKFEHFYVVGKKLILEEEEKDAETCRELFRKVKNDLTEELFEKETEYPGSRSLSAGSCEVCGIDNCTRKTGEPCRFPEKLRYSIESLGGNVGLTARKLLGIELQWIEEGKIPDYFVLIGGLLY